MIRRNCLFVLFWVLATACSVKDTPTILKQGPLPDEGRICRIAVLPFVNQTGYKQGDDIFARVFVAELVNKGGYQIAHEGDVRKFYQQMQLLPIQTPSVEQLRALADLLDVQIVIAGTVVEMRDKSGHGEKLDPSIAVIVRIIEGSSGRTLWASYIRREGKQYRKIMHFGLVNSITSLARNSSAEIVAEWQKQGFKKCTEQ